MHAASGLIAQPAPLQVLTWRAKSRIRHIVLLDYCCGVPLPHHLHLPSGSQRPLCPLAESWFHASICVVCSLLLHLSPSSYTHSNDSLGHIDLDDSSANISYILCHVFAQIIAIPTLVIVVCTQLDSYLMSYVSQRFVSTSGCQQVPQRAACIV